MFISVIIPTYDRKVSLSATLRSLSQQTYPFSQFEVIVVDDGSTDGTASVKSREFPFELKYVLQANQGDAIARNVGAQESNADVLIFLDDDITVEPEFIANIAKALERWQCCVAVGVLRSVGHEQWALYAEQDMQRGYDAKNAFEDSIEVDFTHCLSGIFAIKRRDYLNLGMMEPIVATGSSLWCDVEFGYHAHLKGFVFKRVLAAIGYHHDSSRKDLATYCHRIYRAASAAPLLFRKHPELLAFIPMFHDKASISWMQDRPLLIVRKLARHFASSWVMIMCMEHMVRGLEHHGASPLLLRPLYRWIIGGYVFRGYRQGLQCPRC